MGAKSSKSSSCQVQIWDRQVSWIWSWIPRFKFTTLCIVMVFNSRVLAPLRSPLLDVFRFRLDFFPRSGDAKRGHLLRPLLSSQNLLHRSGSKYYVRLVIRTLVINISYEYFRIDSLNFHKITSKINRPRPDWTHKILSCNSEKQNS